MIILHFFILLIFIALFMLSSGIRVRSEKKESRVKILFNKASIFILKRFNSESNTEIIKKQAMLNPAASGRKEADRYKAEKLTEILIILFAGNILGLILSLSSLNSGSDVENFHIGRSGYGEGDRTVEVTAKVGEQDIEGPIEVTVGERQYTSDETELVFEEIGRLLPEKILGENTSLEKVEYDLNLPDHIDPYPVTIEWSVDDYDVLDNSGIIQEEVTDEKGTPVVLTATLNYMGRYADHVFPVMVYPRHREAAGKLKDLLVRKINKYERLTVSAENLILPQKLGGLDISYKRAPGAAGTFVFFATVVIIITIWYGRDRDLDKAVKLREKEMLIDYPDIVSRLSLFFSAGMTIRGAFEKIASDYEKQVRKGKKEKRFAFEEMLITVREMKGGVPEFQAYQNFGVRSGIRRYGKLGTMLSQDLLKGNKGLLEALEAESRDAFEDRKANARRAGEEAGTKLLLPMAIMLLVVMVIVILPAFMSFTGN